MWWCKSFKLLLVASFFNLPFVAEGRDSPLATSTPRSEASGSVFQQRRQERFLTGTSHSSYRLDPVLERSLSTSVSDLSQEVETTTDSVDEEELFRVRKRAERKERSKRECLAILQMLVKTYQSKHWQNSPV